MRLSNAKQNSQTQSGEFDTEATPMTNLSGTHVHKSKDGKTLWLPLPKELWREAGSCNCEYCGGEQAYWDTLALSADGTGTTWTVHYPELHGKKKARP